MLTKEELAILNQLTAIHKRIKRLPPQFNDEHNTQRKYATQHINALLRLIFSREGIRAYGKQQANQILDNMPELIITDGKGTRREKITPNPDYSYQVNVTPILAEALTGKKLRIFKKGSKIPKGWVRVPYTTDKYIKADDIPEALIKHSVKTIKKVPAGMKRRELTKKDIAELKELMSKGRPTTLPNTPVGWAGGKGKHEAVQKIKVKFADPETLKHQPVGYDLPNAKTGSTFVGGVHSGRREGWVEHDSPMFISDIPRRTTKAKKKKILKKVGKKSPVKKQARKKK